MNSCLLSFLSPPTSNFVMISVARFLGSRSPLRSVSPTRSYWNEVALISESSRHLSYHGRDQASQFLLIDLTITWDVVPSTRIEQCAKGRQRERATDISKATSRRSSKSPWLVAAIAKRNSSKSMEPSLLASNVAKAYLIEKDNTSIISQ